MYQRNPLSEKPLMYQKPLIRETPYVSEKPPIKNIKNNRETKKPSLLYGQKTFPGISGIFGKNFGDFLDKTEWQPWIHGLFTF